MNSGSDLPISVPDGLDTGLSGAFVLVHGAWHGGWCYGRVARILRAAGHQVYAPTLTGLGERSHLADRTITMRTHIQDIVNVIVWERLHDVVLCGHSYGGLIAAAVADAVPERTAALVLLDAPFPESGRSMTELVYGASAPPPVPGEVLSPPVPAALFNVNPADRAMVDGLCVPHPAGTLYEPAELTGAFLGVPAKVHVFATGWESPLGPHRDRAAADPAWSSRTCPGGHDLMIDSPEAVADILLDVASLHDAQQVDPRSRLSS